MIRFAKHTAITDIPEASIMNEAGLFMLYHARAFRRVNVRPVTSLAHDILERRHLNILPVLKTMRVRP